MIRWLLVGIGVAAAPEVALPADPALMRRIVLWHKVIIARRQCDFGYCLRAFAPIVDQAELERSA